MSILKTKHLINIIDDQKAELEMANMSLDSYKSKIEQLEKHIKVIESPTAGWIYVLKNENQRGYKIGCTTTIQRTPTMRARELETTGVVGRFKVEFELRVEDAMRFESKIHTKLALHRMDMSREFFNCPLELIIKTIKEAV